MRGVTVETIVLLGIALVFTFNAALSLLEYLASEQAHCGGRFLDDGSLTQSDMAEGLGHGRPYCSSRCGLRTPGAWA